MCDHHYRPCGVCGAPVHRNFSCDTCLAKVDPWGWERNRSKLYNDLRQRFEILMAAFKRAQEVPHA